MSREKGCQTQKVEWDKVAWSFITDIQSTIKTCSNVIENTRVCSTSRICSGIELFCEAALFTRNEIYPDILAQNITNIPDDIILYYILIFAPSTQLNGPICSKVLFYNTK